MIEIKNLVKDYKSDKTNFRALNDISINFPSRGLFCILGPSGCGKTTLLNLIGGLDSITSGDIFYNGLSLKNISSKEKDAYRNNIVGFIFQNYYLIPQLNVKENVELGLNLRGYSKLETDKLIDSALKEVGLLDQKDKKVNELSGGQAQRVAIARAIVTSPKVILADEPTGALDSKNSKLVLEILKRLSKDKLVILVTHNYELANKYADSIIYLEDGKISNIDRKENLREDNLNQDDNYTNKALSFILMLKLAFRNLFNKKWKTILTSIANSFGMIGIGFFLALNFGFSNYSAKLSQSSASSLPIVANAYSRNYDDTSYGDYNSGVEYPSNQEIYPKVDASNNYSYTLNQFSSKYFNYLDYLQSENLIKSYTVNYGNSYSFNLVTNFPNSIDNKNLGGYNYVNTSISASYNSIANLSNLPTNIFHELYGDLQQYDLIAGEFPKNENELVLVTDKYNSIDFEILQNLGFYNQNDTQDDVQNLNLETKVTPISFEDVLSKEYKIFSNSEVYTYDSLNSLTYLADDEVYKREIKRYKKADAETNYLSNKGETLKIVGILRPKKDSNYSSMSPSLCFLPSLLEKHLSINKTSDINLNATNNISILDSLVDENDNKLSPQEGLIKFGEELYDLYLQFSSSDSSLPIDDFNKLISKYFVCFSLDSSQAYYGFSYLASQANKLGVDLIIDEIKSLDLTDISSLKNYITKIVNLFSSNNVSEINLAYRYLFSIYCYINAYSNIQSVVIFPYDLETRSLLLDKLKEYNQIDESCSFDHASNQQERIFYSELTNSYIIEDVGSMISLVSVILIIFACVSLIVSCSMTSLLTMNNVLERKKEIGLFRSIGARKKDIVMIFETETILLGFVSGIVACLFTYVLTFPINYLISYYYPSYNTGNIADLQFTHCLIILAISILITFISALIPSLKASKQDPVKCFIET